MEEIIPELAKNGNAMGEGEKNDSPKVEAQGKEDEKTEEKSEKEIKRGKGITSKEELRLGTLHELKLHREGKRVFNKKGSTFQPLLSVSNRIGHKYLQIWSI